jgi:hypothetical protein
LLKFYTQKRIRFSTKGIVRTWDVVYIFSEADELLRHSRFRLMKLKDVIPSLTYRRLHSCDFLIEPRDGFHFPYFSCRLHTAGTCLARVTIAQTEKPISIDSLDTVAINRNSRKDKKQTMEDLRAFQLSMRNSGRSTGKKKM